jgi:hypothetical protein
MLNIMSMALQAFLFLVPGFVAAGFLFSAGDPQASSDILRFATYCVMDFQSWRRRQREKNRA